MSIRVALTHRTSYKYDRKIRLGPQVIRLRPAPHARPKIVSYSQTIGPEDHFLNWQQDPFGNYQARAVFEEPTDRFEVLVDLVVDMIAINPFDFFVDENVFHAPFSYGQELARDLAPYLVDEIAGTQFDALGEDLKARWRESEGQEVRTVDFLVALNQRVFDLVDYLVRMEPGVQSPEETLTKKSGSCRDSAWLLVNLLRRVGIAARFVSGYLIQLAPDERVEGEANGPEADFTDLHAWAEAFIPGAGWIGLDATSGLFAGEGHIPLAATPMPGSAAPITGALEPCDVTFDFDMQVRRLREPARITKPLTDLQWEAVDQAGQAVDDILMSEDVRLTMGGEPTFIASSDRDAEEWTIAAVGPTKRQFADTLARRLLKKFAPGGVLTHGQGKWYPGEPLPRWAYSIVWREDGHPVWNNLDLIEGEKPEVPATPEAAEVYVRSLSEALDLRPEFAQAVYEDPADFIVREGNLPENLTPGDSKLDDPVERERLARIFSEGLSKPAAFVLPLQEAQADSMSGRAIRWMSEIWETRRNSLCLIPGDSPAGFRLPMKSLPWVDPILYPGVQQVDPFVERPALSETSVRRQSRKRREHLSEAAPVAPTETGSQTRDWIDGAGDPVRTALVVQPRDGYLNVFLPPTSKLEAYLDLIETIEAVAEQHGQPVRIEGYGPPRDPRVREIKVTPDPGVIEVNIHPVSTWPDLRDNTRIFYEEARACGLDASGFMVDGRPTGSGGGAHITVGGAQASDSPFLRRPDVLGSIIRYWQAHPSLSYLFAGMFIGPTSQAPRIDEARSDLLFEMELALKQLPEKGASGVPPWLVDRVLRHLLVDVTGNTHRAEICIDKLYSPDGPAGRLGLVEFRGFEMPPHWQMNAAQQLILRALIAWFWKTPNTAPLIDHGHGLTDQFLLPDVLWADFKTVLGDVSAGLGIDLDPNWFVAQFDFRFPLAGRIEHDGYVLELRNALEPWHVLGEEGAATGTARFVDSSLERLQVKLTTPRGARPLKVACNGNELPFQMGLRDGEQICGVRFRSWLPESCLHPTIAPHGPLIFDLFDPVQSRAVAGCTYHTSHPGGRNFETRPINALEAEGRRLARFYPHGHTAGFTSLSSQGRSPGFPYTLDMRLLS
ncbi:MAG: transglutaminase family protein [Pseudomonadota bacterium]